MERVITHTRTLVCLAPNNRRKITKCINEQMRDVERKRYEEESNIKSTKIIHDSQLKASKRWLENGEKSEVIHTNELYEQMQKLANEDFSRDDFKRQEYESYSLFLYKMLITETNLQRRDLRYTDMFGDKWIKNDEIFKIQERINASMNRCGEFKSKERVFKKKYFQDHNYLIKGIDVL